VILNVLENADTGDSVKLLAALACIEYVHVSYDPVSKRTIACAGIKRRAVRFDDPMLTL
jgi:hypothetical protein